MRLSILITVLVVTAVLAGIPYVPAHRAAGGPSAAVSDVHPTSAGGFDRTIFASGVVEGRCREVKLQFEPTGRLASINVCEGQQVRAGELLATLEASIWQHQLAQAEASLALAVAERERLVNGQRPETREVAEAEVRVAEVRTQQARTDFERTSKLVQSNAVSRQEFEDREAAFRGAQAELALAASKAAEVKAKARDDEVRQYDAKFSLEKAHVAQAKATLAKAELRAPTNGIILRISAELGELVGAQSRDPLLTMVDASELRVRASVEELDAVRVCEGMTVKVTADGWPNKSFPGRVVACSPHMVPKRYLSNKPGERIDVSVREVVVRLDQSDARDQLVVGLPVDVYLQVSPPD